MGCISCESEGVFEAGMPSMHSCDVTSFQTRPSKAAAPELGHKLGVMLDRWTGRQIACEEDWPTDRMSTSNADEQGNRTVSPCLCLRLLQA